MGVVYQTYTPLSDAYHYCRILPHLDIHLGRWCSPVNTSPCHGEDRGFKSLPARHPTSPFGLRWGFPHFARAKWDAPNGVHRR